LHGQSRRADSAPGSCARPWTRRRCLALGRLADTLNLLGPALRKAVGLAAAALGRSAAARIAEADLALVGPSRLTAALALDGGEPTARARAWGLGLEEVERWQRGLEPQACLAGHEPPRQEGMATFAQSIAPATAPAPKGSPGGRCITPRVAPDRRLSLEDQDRRHGRKSSAKPFNGFTEPWRVDLESTVTREVVVRPAHEPEHEVGEGLAEALEKRPGLLPLDIAFDLARPRIAQWAAPGVHVMARPWPPGGHRCTKYDVRLDFVPGMVACPGGVTGPMVLGRSVEFPASACDACLIRTQCPHAQLGPGRSLQIRADEPCPQKLRAQSSTKRGRACLRQRTAVEHAISHQFAPQGRRARDKGLRKHPCDGRRQAAGSNLQVAARSAEERSLAS
jgi:DDE family transposase